MPTTGSSRRRALGYAIAAVILSLTFWAYLRPDLMVDLANLVWSCL